MELNGVSQKLLLTVAPTSTISTGGTGFRGKIDFGDLKRSVTTALITVLDFGSLPSLGRHSGQNENVK